MRFVVLALLLTFSAFAAPPVSGNAKLDEARRLFDDLELDKAAKALAAAEATVGNSRDVALQILELQGLVFGTMNKEAKVRDAFRALLVLEPSSILPKDQPPRVRTPFFEAREWAASNPLQIETTTTGCEQSRCTPTVRVASDVLRLIKKVRFVVTEGAEPTTKEVAVETSTAQLSLGAWGTWRAELLGKSDAVLVEVGPFSVGVRPTPVAAPVAEQTPTEPASSLVSARPAASSPMRTVGFITGGVGVVAVAIGLAFGLASTQTRARITGATTNDSGLTTSLTQREATGLESQARSQATLANVLFVGGGVLAAAGAVLVIVGSLSPESPVTWSLTPQGISVWGRF
jgi:hypothetical protein